jgi:DNA primase
MRSDVHEIVNCLRNRTDGADPMQCLVEQAHRQVLASIFVSVHGAEPEVSHVEEAVMTVRRASLEQEQRSLRAALQEAERRGQIEEVLQLTRRSQDVTRKLRDLD